MSLANQQSDGEGEFPRVTWDELREHLVTRLMMDPEWIVDGPDRLDWWPTPLPMMIQVLDEGTFPDSTENWLRVSGSTRIADVEESLGRQLASEYAPDYPVGALIYQDGALYLTTIYSFNPRNRTLLDWFHESLLIQSAVALELAREWTDIDGIAVDTPPHPSSGVRDDVDDLVRIYEGDELGVDTREAALEHFALIRPLLRDTFIRNGYHPSFSNGEVDFYNFGFEADDTEALTNGAFDFALGFMNGMDLERKLGPSLRIAARVLPPGVSFDAEQVTHVNNALCDLPFTGVFGHVSGPELSEGGSQLWATVPHLTLVGWVPNIIDYQNSVLNAVWHVTAAAQTLRREVLGIDWPQQNGGESD